MTKLNLSKKFAALEGRGERWAVKYLKQVTAYRKHQFELTQYQGVLTPLPTQLSVCLAKHLENYF